MFLNGDIVLDAPSITFLLKYGIISDKYAEIKIKAREKLNLSLSSQELTFDKSLSIPLGSLVIPIAVTGGTVNVTVSLNLVFEANGTAKISAGFSQDIVIDAGMTATLSPAKITSFNNSTFDWDLKQPQIEGEVNYYRLQPVVVDIPTYDGLKKYGP